MILPDMYRDFMAQSLAPTDVPTRARLLPAIDQVMNAIEVLCPVAMIVTADGVAAAAGPTGMNGARFVIIAATINSYVCAGLKDWPEIVKIPTSVNHSMLWKLTATAIAAGNHDEALGYLTARLGKQGISRIERELQRFAKQGLTPVVFSLAYGSDTLGAGVIGTFPLPASIEQQIAEIEAEAP